MAAESLTAVGTLYSAPVGFVFIFNLICGTGILTMPRAFEDAGWLLSLISVTVLAAIGYLTVTYLIESMAVANALLKLDEKNANTKKNPAKITGTPAGTITNDEKTPLIEESNIPSYSGVVLSTKMSGSKGPSSKEIETGLYDYSGEFLSTITMRVELGQMASMFYPKKAMIVGSYLMLCIYLFGDMAIYSVAVPKSLRNVACTYVGNASEFGNTTDYYIPSEDEMCWPGVPSISRLNAYRLFLAIFIVIFGPFIFFNVQKTKYLQLFTVTSRFLSFATMIVLILIRLSNGYEAAKPEIANFMGLPTLFGVCVYSFMTHHSLPSLVTPIKNKNSLLTVLGLDYIAILALSGVLSLTGVFAFRNVLDLITLNFFHDKSLHPITNILFIEYFLALFPVFTLSTTYPLIGVTLRNNLITLGHLFRESYPGERIIFPLITIVPPAFVAGISTNVEFLVSFTGSYAGAVIQYLIPAVMVYYARIQFKSAFGEDAVNKHRSPFKHWIWLLLVTIWFVICIVFVTVNHIMTGIASYDTNHHLNDTAVNATIVLHQN